MEQAMGDFWTGLVFFEMEVVETQFFIGQIRYSRLIITLRHILVFSLQ
jgi:hypothetical protein